VFTSFFVVVFKVKKIDSLFIVEELKIFFKDTARNYMIIKTKRKSVYYVWNIIFQFFVFTISVLHSVSVSELRRNRLNLVILNFNF